MSIRLWKYYWHLILVLSLVIFTLWMQNPPASKTVSMNCQSKDCETIPLSFTQPYVPQEIPIVSKPYLLMVENNMTKEPTER